MYPIWACPWGKNFSNLVPLESRLYGMNISETAGQIYSIRSFMELSAPVVVQRHGRLPICPVWACSRVKNLWKIWYHRCPDFAERIHWKPLDALGITQDSAYFKRLFTGHSDNNSECERLNSASIYCSVPDTSECVSSRWDLAASVELGHTQLSTSLSLTILWTLGTGQELTLHSQRLPGPGRVVSSQQW